MKARTYAFATTTAIIIITAIPQPLLAADTTTPPTTPGLSDLLTAWGVTVNGDISASYHHSNGYPGSTWRGFDQSHDAFQLDEAGLQVGYQPKSGVGGYLDILAGTNAQILNQLESTRNYGPYNAAPTSSGIVNVRQAYLQYATGPLTFIAGKFSTLSGAETLNPAYSDNFSHSLLFWETAPATHTGVRATWAVDDTLSFSLGVNNGWNYTNVDTSGSKTGEVNVIWNPTKTISTSLSGYYGKDEVLYDGQMLSLIDFIGTYDVTPALTLMVNAEFTQVSGNGNSGFGATTHLNGYALYATYAFNERWRIMLRAEYMDDRDGVLISTTYGGTQPVTHVPGHTTEGTVTVGYSPVKNFELRAEVRYDHAQQNDDTFVRSLNPTLYANNNTEVAFQALYKFALP